MLLATEAGAAATATAPAPALTVTQKNLGNIFSTTEPVEIGVATRAANVAWTVYDFWNQKVAAGTIVPSNGAATVSPTVADPGYYLLELRATNSQGAELQTAWTTFARLTPIAPSDVVGSPFGVMTHFAQGWDTDIMPLIAKCGISTIRDEAYWAQVERTRGVYDFSSFDPYMAAAEKNRLQPLTIMSFTNPLYDSGDVPKSPEGRLAYANYGKAILDHWGDEIKFLEIWNEYNGSWGPHVAGADRGQWYAEMIRAAYPVLKKKRPDVTILGGAALQVPLPYFDDIFRHGGLAAMDGVVIHPYRTLPEGVDDETRDLQTLIRKYNRGASKPVFTTECGDIDPAPGGRERVASYLARICTLLLSAGNEKIVWYLARDYNEFKSTGLMYDGSSEFGRYCPTPAYAAYANLIRQLSHATFVRRDSTSGNVRMYQFDRRGRPVHVCWAVAPSHVVVKVSHAIRCVDITGGERVLTPLHGEIFLTLGLDPLYLLGDIGNVSDAGQFVLEAEQTVDLGSVPALLATWSGPGGLRWEVGDRWIELPAAPKPVQVTLPLPEMSTHSVRDEQVLYRVIGNGGTAGEGQLTLHVADPLKVQNLRASMDGTRYRRTKFLADSVADFSSVQGFRDWSYGYEEGKGPFQPLLYDRTAMGYEWGAPINPFLKIDRDGGHPGASNGAPVWAVRRWTSPCTGTIRIAGELGRPDRQGDGVVARVFIDGQQAMERFAPPGYSGTYQLVTRVRKHQVIDFALTPGPGTNIDYDASTFTARIELVEPVP